jgi:hypothetical protein
VSSWVDEPAKSNWEVSPMGTSVITSTSAAIKTSQAIPDAVSNVVFRAQEGDREAFATLFELHKKRRSNVR